jgi:hypothetical protein
MKTKTTLMGNSMNRSRVRHLFLHIPLVLACFALSPVARATCQEGCDTNEDTILGDDALFSLTTGADDTAVGFNALYSNTTGTGNTAHGEDALYSNTTGNNNTAVGAAALFSNTTASGNTAHGYQSLMFNTTGSSNTAHGYQALFKNATGNSNTATGDETLIFNTTGSFNTASGANACESNTRGNGNTANGYSALLSNTTGNNNVATGFKALLFSTTGGFNTANGSNALFNNTTGMGNTADGNNALLNNTTGNNNIALGISAGRNLTMGNDNIDIGNAGRGGESGMIRIGTTGTQTLTFIAGISGAVVPTGVAVIVDANGQLGTTTSSARFKDEIKPMDRVSEAILALKPVTFRYKKELDPEGIPQFGLVAEDVEKVNPDLVARDEQGKPYTVRYEAVNAMLLNEFLKAHRAFLEEGRKVKRLETALEAINKCLKEQDAKIQKVHDEVEMNKPAPQMVLNQ